MTVAATSSQLYPEALSGMAFAQWFVRSASDFGTFSSSMSMQSGAPTLALPNPSRSLHRGGPGPTPRGAFPQGGGLCASKIPDAQAAYEAANTLQHAMLAGVNLCSIGRMARRRMAMGTKNSSWIWTRRNDPGFLQWSDLPEMGLGWTQSGNRTGQSLSRFAQPRPISKPPSTAPNCLITTASNNGRQKGFGYGATCRKKWKPCGIL
ncbi:MAG: hypothetical protein Ct9H90mP9_1790 [Pseudomonadota bacterium]|nr:MAG: hypothetical protein Ct9H90mP9_1790 [Pseudomonadota bacterium]